jgi:hypothetical protein
MSAAQVPLNRFYPVEALAVSLADKGRLQQALDQVGVIRLEPGDYAKDTAGTLRLRSGMRIYGLGNNIPPVVIEPGSENIVLSAIHTTLTFPPGEAVTRNNLFSRVTYSEMVVDGATLEDNLFLNASYQTWKINTTKRGMLKNNRFIKFLSHGGNPGISWQGGGRRSSGNVFLWINLLDPRGRCADFSGLADLSLIFLDVESYSGDVDEGIRVRDVGRLSIVGSGGLMNHGRSLDLEADSVLLHGHHMGSVKPPGVILEAKTGNAVVIDSGQNQIVDDRAKDRLRLRLFSEDILDKSTTLNGKTLPASLNAEQAQDIAKIAYLPSAGVAWERPQFDPPPDPAGAKWKTGLESKPSSSAALQEQLDRQGVVLLGPGTYYLDKPLRLGRGKGLVGAGMDRTVLIAKSPETDLIVSDGTAGLMLCDLTLQGGRNGIYHRWSAGPPLQFTDVLLSHVTIRNMADSGIKYENIYGWDNNFIAQVHFVDCAYGFRQVGSHFGSDQDPVLSYMDKNVFYQCQFIGCGKALELLSYRNSQNNAWVNCLFKDSRIEAVRLGNHSLTMFANCDFIDNAGQPSVLSNGRLYLISCAFETSSAATFDFVDAYGLTAEGCTFKRSGQSQAVVQSGKPAWITFIHPDNVRTFENRNSYFTNCTVSVPVGAIRNAVIFNSLFSLDQQLNAKGVFLLAGKALPWLSGQSDPEPMLLRGSVFPYRLTSGNDTTSPMRRKKP